MLKGVATETFNAAWIATDYTGFKNAFDAKTNDQYKNQAEQKGNEAGDKVLKEAGVIKK